MGAVPGVEISAAATPATSGPEILQLIETGGPGGAEQVLVSLAEQLMQGPDTRAAVGLLKEGWLADTLRDRGLEITLLDLQRALDPGFLWRLTRLIRRRQSALVHAHEFAMNLYGTMAGRLAGVPVVATVHGKNYYADAGRRVLAMRLLPRMGATVVAVSHDIQGYLEHELGVRGVRVIPNGIDVHRFDGSARAAARQALGIDEQTVLIGAVGNLYPVKGHSVLVEAVAQLQEPRVQLVIAGRGEEEEALRQQALAAGIADRVHLLGFREDVPRLLAAFDIYALPSFSEGQSLALIEAMAAGLPIVATRVGGNPEIITDQEHGLLSAAGDPAALSAGLRLLLDQPVRARQLADAARARARQEFSLEAMVRRYRELYVERGLEVGR